METNMFKEIYHAKYLMPMDASKLNLENKNTENGTSVIKEESILQFLLITNAGVPFSYTLILFHYQVILEKMR